MFDNSFPFTKLFKKEVKGSGHLKCRTTYEFSTPLEKYIIESEEYKHNIHIIKFFPKRLKTNPKRFNILTGEKKMGHIVGTCIILILQILKKNPGANFGFLGSHTIDFKRQYEESRECTKRFKIYRYAVYSLIGEHVFAHEMDEKNSTYLLINRSNKDIEMIKKEANKMFDLIFPTLQGI